VFAGLAELAKALAHPNRIEILEFLGQGDRSVEAIAEGIHLSVANASQHLRLMQRAGLLISRREGKRVLYGLSDPAVVELMGALSRLAEKQTAEVQSVVASYFHQRDSLEPVSRSELMDRIEAGLVTVLDVRPGSEFGLGHLPGALNIPFGELERRLGELSADREVVAYCRGPYCVLSFEAVVALRAKGFRVRRLEDGYPEWRAAGLPVETPA
jgi:ArsR family transcriptional regulator